MYSTATVIVTKPTWRTARMITAKSHGKHWRVVVTTAICTDLLTRVKRLRSRQWHNFMISISNMSMKLPNPCAVRQPCAVIAYRDRTHIHNRIAQLLGDGKGEVANMLVITIWRKASFEIIGTGVHKSDDSTESFHGNRGLPG